MATNYQILHTNTSLHLGHVTHTVVLCQMENLKRRKASSSVNGNGGTTVCASLYQSVYANQLAGNVRLSCPGGLYRYLDHIALLRWPGEAGCRRRDLRQAGVEMHWQALALAAGCGHRINPWNATVKEHKIYR